MNSQRTPKMPRATVPRFGGVTAAWCDAHGGVSGQGPGSRCQIRSKPHYLQAEFYIIPPGDPIDPDVAISSGWKIVNNRAVRFVPFFSNWFQAMLHASQNYAGELAAPLNADDQLAIYNTVVNGVTNQRVWLGADDIVLTYSWRLSTSYGVSAPATPNSNYLWAPGEPNHDFGWEECFELYVQAGVQGRSNDLNCFLAEGGYVVERRLTYIPTTTSKTMTSTTVTTQTTMTTETATLTTDTTVTASTTTTIATPTMIPGGGVTAPWCTSRLGTITQDNKCEVRADRGFYSLEIVAGGSPITVEEIAANSWTVIGNRAVKLIATGSVSHFEAIYQASTTWNAELVTIQSPADQQSIWNLAPSTAERYWVGGDDIRQETIFHPTASYAVDDILWSPTQTGALEWAIGEPNNYVEGEDCVEM
ncbi:hypothetical protein M427DRAFT_401650 [Gonapodya prolifera JEL478]|uniref:C-type lectin domain-containing protein n=1 Tax=Gonapodya prolifera (strain JEL478) TaxID=1344416 RepID=A0A139ATM8_GONPJ|nr:hypothetical protein M427DRAFT_401650 [Gonapodya prolifera JEL478]|eukprot:KXS20081.1 hypothetical protein M427DRAFT_401650 [Gonapodya prolifera JEL478]